MSAIKRLLTISAGVGLLVTPAGLNQSEAYGPHGGFTGDPDTLTDFTVAAFNDWRRERSEFTLHVTETPSNPEERRLAKIRDDVAASPLGQRLLHDLGDTNTTMAGDALKLDADGDTLGAYLFMLDVVLLKDATPRGRQILHAAHELRHAWQDERGLMSEGLDLHQQDHAARVFMTEADARAFAIAVAWELKQGGDTAAWDAAMGMTIYRDTATNFDKRMSERLAQKPEGETYDDADIRSAMGEAYRTWFSRHIFRQPYIESIQEATEKYHGRWPGYQAMPGNITRLLGQLPGIPQGARGPSYLGRSDLELAKHHARIAFPVLASSAAANDDRAPTYRIRMGLTL